MIRWRLSVFITTVQFWSSELLPSNSWRLIIGALQIRILQEKLDQPVSAPPSPRDVSMEIDSPENMMRHIRFLKNEVERLKKSLRTTELQREWPLIPSELGSPTEEDEEEARRSLLNHNSGGTFWVVFDKLEGWLHMSDWTCVFKRLPVLSNPSTFYNFSLCGGAGAHPSCLQPEVGAPWTCGCCRL